jgi:CheY-like chemotaxis protein
MKRIVLLIDDDEEDHEVFMYYLRQYNPDIKVISAYRGSHGIELIPIALPDWIFLDINMPQMNGLDVLKAIKRKKEYDHIPIYIYSTSDGYKSKQLALALGAAGYFKKPTSFSQFKEIFRTVISFNR